MNNIQDFEAEAEEARQRIADAIAELGDRLSPQTIIREAKAEGRKALLDVKDDGLRALSGVRDQAAETLDQAEHFVVQNWWAFGLGAAALGVAATVGPQALRNGGRVRSGGDLDNYADYAQTILRPLA